MPRSSTATGRGVARSSSMKKTSSIGVSASPSKQASFASTTTTVTIPLNDDAAEKARRHEKRQALHDIQMNKLVAAATPRKSVGDQGQGTPGGTPNKGINVVGQQTPGKKVPILANFEEWMKMVTDNVGAFLSSKMGTSIWLVWNLDPKYDIWIVSWHCTWDLYRK